MMREKLFIICFAAALTSCTVGPNYQRPKVPAPPHFRAGEEQPTQTSLGDVKWFSLFDDQALRDLIKEALQANYDIRIAAERIVQAEGRLSATRSLFSPQMNLTHRRSTDGCLVATPVNGSWVRFRHMGNRPFRETPSLHRGGAR